MIDGNIDVLSLEGMLVSSVSLEGDLLPIGPKGDKGDPGFSPVVTTSKSGKTTTVKFETATGNVYAYIQDGEDGQGSGDMLTDVYDKNKNGIVDDAEKVNGKTVLSNVPANAVFTDTVYDDTEVRSLINAKPDFSDIPTNVSELTNDAHYVSSDGASTVSGENTDFSLTGTTEGMFKKLDLKGNTSQETYTGKNLIGLVDGDYSENGLTIKVIDGVLNVNGTASAATTKYIPLVNNFVMPANTTYTFRAKLIGGEVQSAGNIATRLMTSSTGATFVNYRTLNNAATGTVSQQTTYTTVMFYINPNYSTTNAKIGYQLELGSTATSFEQYCGGTPSPNPSYPQDVNNVSGDNDIVICGKNLFDGNYINAYIGGDSGNHFGINNNTRMAIIQCKPNTTYTITKYINTGIGTRFYVYEYPTLLTEYTNMGEQSKLFKNDNATTATVTTSSTGYYLYVYVTNDTSSIPYLQIENGSTATTYEAYTGATYNIDLPVENLIDDSLKASALNNVYIGTGSTSLEMPFKAGTYTISTNVSAYLQYLDTTTHSSSTETTQWTFTLENDTNIRIRIQKIGLVASDVEWVQVEKGTHANTYTPYGTTPIELNKIGTYQDYFYKENNKWYLHKETGKVVLNGSETYEYISSKGGFTIPSNQPVFSLRKTSVYNGYCNNFKVNTTDTTWVAVNYCGWNNTNVFWIKDDGNIATNINDFKTWLSTHNTTIYYVLATPTNTEITDTTLISQLNALYKAYTYKNKTNISQSNNDLPFILNVEAFTDTYNGRYENIINMIKKVQ